jgi:glucosamine-6-phosphate deaminase
MRVFIEPDAATLSLNAARIVADTLSTQPDAVLALPTGRTPLGLYAELVRINLNFSRARIFNLDEYLGVPSNNPRSFNSYLWTHLLSHVNVQRQNIYLLPSTANEDTCAAYEAEIRRAGGIDLLIAGVGTNGHIAFNEPGSPLDSRTRIVSLAPSTMANMRAVFPNDPIPNRAVTMGIGTILEARKILVLASGLSKKPALAGLLNGPVTTDNPISAVRLHADVTVISDQQAMG